MLTMRLGLISDDGDDYDDHGSNDDGDSSDDNDYDCIPGVGSYYKREWQINYVRNSSHDLLAVIILIMT